LEPETTNIRVIDPTTHPCPLHACPPPCAPPPPRPLCSALPPPPRPLCSTPTATIVAGNTRPPFPLRRIRCHVAPTPSPPLRTRAPPRIPLAYKTSALAPSVPIPSKTLPIKYPLPNCKQLHFSTPSPLRSQCLVILGLKTVAHGS
jgi:hypothetical protein